MRKRGEKYRKQQSKEEEEDQFGDFDKEEEFFDQFGSSDERDEVYQEERKDWVREEEEGFSEAVVSSNKTADELEREKFVRDYYKKNQASNDDFYDKNDFLEGGF